MSVLSDLLTQPRFSGKLWNDRTGFMFDLIMIFERGGKFATLKQTNLFAETLAFYQIPDVTAKKFLPVLDKANPSFNRYDFMKIVRKMRADVLFVKPTWRTYLIQAIQKSVVD